MAEKAILFDSTKCTACRACQVACKQWWELPGAETHNKGTYENPENLMEETWNKIRFKEIAQNGRVRWLFTRQACLHCTTAVCVWVCPAYARTYHPLGYVAIDQNRCIECGRCEEYCPFDVPRLGGSDLSPRVTVTLGPRGRDIAYNCRFCEDRVNDRLTPSCVKTCAPGALQFGERGDLVAQGRARVDALKATYPKAYLYGENELGGLHVMYVLTEEPSVHGLPDQPRFGTYPEFHENFPDWYTQAIAGGTLPVFPPGARPEWYLQPPLVATAAMALARPGLDWLGVGGAAALGWIVRRRMTQEEEKQKTRKA